MSDVERENSGLFVWVASYDSYMQIDQVSREVGKRKKIFYHKVVPSKLIIYRQWSNFSAKRSRQRGWKERRWYINLLFHCTTCHPFFSLNTCARSGKKALAKIAVRSDDARYAGSVSSFFSCSFSPFLRLLVV